MGATRTASYNDDLLKLYQQDNTLLDEEISELNDLKSKYETAYGTAERAYDESERYRNILSDLSTANQNKASNNVKIYDIAKELGRDDLIGLENRGAFLKQAMDEAQATVDKSTEKYGRANKDELTNLMFTQLTYMGNLRQQIAEA